MNNFPEFLSYVQRRMIHIIVYQDNENAQYFARRHHIDLEQFKKDNSGEITFELLKQTC